MTTAPPPPPAKLSAAALLESAAAFEAAWDQNEARGLLERALGADLTETGHEPFVRLCLRLCEPALGLRLLIRGEAGSGQSASLLRAACQAALGEWRNAAECQLLAVSFPFKNGDEERCEVLRLSVFCRQAGMAEAEAAASRRLAAVGLPSVHAGLTLAQETLKQRRHAEAAGFAASVLAQVPDQGWAADMLGQSLRALDKPHALLDAAARHPAVTDPFGAIILNWMRALEDAGQRDRSCLLLRAAQRQSWTDLYTQAFRREALRLHRHTDTAARFYAPSAALLFCDGAPATGKDEWEALYLSFFSGSADRNALPHLPDEQLLVLTAPEETRQGEDALASIDAMTPQHSAALTWGGAMALRAGDLRDLLAAWPEASASTAGILPAIAKVARIAWADPPAEAPVFEPRSLGTVWHALAEPLPMALAALGGAGLAIQSQHRLLNLTDQAAIRALRQAIWREGPSALVVPERDDASAAAAVTGLRVAVLSEADCLCSDPAALLRLIGARRDPVAVALGSGIGNIILGTPLVRRLAEALGRPVDVILNADYAGCEAIFGGSPWVHAVYNDVSQVTPKPYELVLVTHFFGMHRPLFAAGLTLNARDHGHVKLMETNHEADVNLRLMRDQLQIPFKQADTRRQFLSTRRHNPPGSGRIGVHAGSKPGRWAVKRWPHFEALCARLIARGYEVVSVGAADEALPGTVDKTGLPLAATFDVISSCDAFIANDSGLMHAADALGVPLIAIFGPTSVVKNGPLSPQARVVRIDRACSPCQFDRERLDRCNCIADISIAEVEAAFDALWHENSAAEPEPASLRAPTPDFAAERTQAALMLEDPATLMTLPDIDLAGLLSRAPVLGLAEQVARIPAAARSLLPRRHPAILRTFVEAAAFALTTEELSELLTGCLEDALAVRAHAALGEVLTLLLTLCGAGAATLAFRRLQSDWPQLVLARRSLRHTVAMAKAQADKDLTSPDIPLASALTALLEAGDKEGFQAALNCWLATWRSTHDLALQLRTATDALAKLGLGRQALWRQPERADLLDVLLFPASPLELAETGEIAILQSAACGDHARLNQFLNAALGELAPLQITGPDLAGALTSVLARHAPPAKASHGRATIIIAAHAPDPALLHLAIDSCLRQSYQDMEIVLIDDASPMSIESLITATHLNHPKLRLHRMAHQSGPYACRNAGLSLTSGPWVAFHDADDVAHPQRLEVQIAALAADPARRVCYAGHVRFDAQARVQPEVEGNIIGDGPVTSVFRREVFADIGDFSPVQSRGDIEMRARVTLAYGAGAVLRIDRPLLFCAGGHTLSVRALNSLAAHVQLFRRAFSGRRVCAPPSSPGAAAVLGPLAIPPALLGGSPRARGLSRQ